MKFLSLILISIFLLSLSVTAVSSNLDRCEFSNNESYSVSRINEININCYDDFGNATDPAFIKVTFDNENASVIDYQRTSPGIFNSIVWFNESGEYDVYLHYGSSSFNKTKEYSISVNPIDKKEELNEILRTKTEKFIDFFNNNFVYFILISFILIIFYILFEMSINKYNKKVYN